MSNGFSITPNFRIDRLCDHTFLPALLNSESVVVDFGANRGEFAHGLISRFGCRVYAAEPLAGLQQEIKASPYLHLFRVAIGGQDGTARLNVFRSRCASVLGSREIKDSVQAEEDVEVVSLRTFLDLTKLERVDLMKVDVEGAEVAMFESASETDLLRIGQITVEFHDFIYPELQPRVEAVKKRLQAIGFWRINFSLDNTDVLFFNHDLPVISLLRYGTLKYLTRNVEGARRRLRRMRENPKIPRRRAAIDPNRIA